MAPPHSTTAQITSGSTMVEQIPLRTFDDTQAHLRDPDLDKYLSLVTLDETRADDVASQARIHEIETAPLFSGAVSATARVGRLNELRGKNDKKDLYPQFGVLGLRLATYKVDEYGEDVDHTEERSEANLVMANMDAPWSAFICGSQGGGKSHTLSCILENALISPSRTGKLPKPLAGVVFHYDKFSNYSTTQLCEAAYLCTANVPVRVLVSPSNFKAMEKMYTNMPGLPKGCPKPRIVPLYLQEKHLNVTRMMTLMAVSSIQGNMPLYLEVVLRLLREMGAEHQGARPGVDWKEFKKRIENQGFMDKQDAPLRMRLSLVESFLDGGPGPKLTNNQKKARAKLWDFEPGSLTIVDLSCPYVNENDACALFSICLSLALENRGTGGRIVALDEAHKFLTQSGEAQKFTEQLTSIICQQRHLATRVVIATQEPTLSPRLLDLCNVTIVHKFLSPAWFEILKGHLAGVGLAKAQSERAVAKIFSQIVGLKTGEALLFSPSAMLDVREVEDTGRYLVQELRERYVKMRVRKRVTADGGRSIMATDAGK